MLVGLNRNGKRVQAERGILQEAFCPACGELLINKVNGEKKRPHFSHQVNTKCEYGKGETEAHMDCKLRLKEKIEHFNDFKVSELEYWLEDGFVCDYYCELESGHKIIFEIVDKNTDLSVMKNYNKGDYVVCLICIDRFERGKDVRIDDKELRVHDSCNGRIYTFDYETKRWFIVHFSRDKDMLYTGKQLRRVHKKSLRDFNISFDNYFFNKKWW